jgi:predicted MFS family arabinose efflux permease
MSAQTAEPERLVAWRGVVPAFIATMASMLPGFLIAGFAVQIRADIDLSLSGLGILIGVFFGSAAIVSPAMGRFAESAGWANGLRVATVLTAISLSGIGWLATSTLSLAFFYVVGGLGSSLAQIASNLAVARCVDIRKQGLVFGLRHASVPAAAMLAGLAVPSIALTVGWRWGFRGAVLIAAIAAVAIPAREEGYVINPPREQVGGGRRKTATPTRLLVLLAIAVGLGTGGGDTVGAFVVSYAVEQGITEESAGLLLAIGSFCGLAARVVSGWLIDRRQHADLTAVAAMIAIGMGGVILLGNSGVVGLVIGAMIAFTSAWGWAGLFTFAIVKDNPGAPAAASGITQVGKYLGAALGPPIFGTIADRVSFTASWWFTAAAMLGAVALILYVRNQRPQ